MQEGSTVLPVLTYHYVESPRGATSHGAALTTAPIIFEKQLAALQERSYRTIFVKEIPSILTKVPSPAPPGSRINGHPSPPVALTFDDGYADFAHVVLPLLKKYQAKATLFVVPDFIGRAGYLTRQELQDCIDSGLVEIGAHTLHHADLTRLATAAARTEITRSIAALEQDYGVTVTSFAYPFGRHTPRIEKLVEESGCTAAVTTDRGWNQSAQQIRSIKRIPARAFVGSRKWKAIGDI